MDNEKMVNSRFFAVCEWLWRLVVLNFLTLVVCCGVITILGAFTACVNSFKDYQEGCNRNVFSTYFQNFKKCFLRSIIHSVIFVIISLVIAYAIWTYLLNLEVEDLEENYARFYSIGLTITLFFGLVIVIIHLQFPLLYTYFNFSVIEQYKMGIYMGLKYILVTLVGLGSVVGSVAMFLYATPLWFFIGVSLPLFLLYIVSKNKYSYLAYNINDIKEVDDLGYEREDDETRN